MGQKKLQRFAELRTFRNVLEYPENMQGKWSNFFKNDHPIVLELACGKGEYAVGLGRMFPEKNFIGVDLKGNRIWVGAKQALAEPLNNVAFIRSQIDKIPAYFEKGEVDEIWLTFPDPQLRNSKAKKRLTHPNFLRLYQQVTTPQSHIHLKTDSPALFDFTLKVIELYDLPLYKKLDNIYAEPDLKKELQIKTHYEGLDIAGSNRVHYIEFGLKPVMPREKDTILKEMIFEDQP